MATEEELLAAYTTAHAAWQTAEAEATKAAEGRRGPLTPEEGAAVHTRRQEYLDAWDALARARGEA